MTASPDTTIRVWNVSTSQTTLLLKAHDAPVTGLSLHPTGDYLLSSSLDQHWAFSDIRTGRLLTKVCFKLLLYTVILNYKIISSFKKKSLYLSFLSSLALFFHI